MASEAITSDVGGNIFPDMIPQGTDWETAIVLSDQSAEPDYYLGGEAGRHTAVIQVDYYTKGTNGKYAANNGGELIRNRLSGYRGQFGSGCSGVARLVRCNTLAAEPIDATDQWRYRVSMDFEINHTATQPTFS